MRIFPLRLAACCAVLTLASPAESQLSAPAPTYADLADLALAAPVTAQVRLTRSIEIKGERAANVPQSLARFYVEADIVSLIRSVEPLPTRVNYLLDVPRDARGKAPKLRKGSEYILFAAPVRGQSAGANRAARAQAPRTGYIRCPCAAWAPCRERRGEGRAGS